MSGIIKYLAWDSTFFGLKIGAINWEPEMSMHCLEEQARASAYDLVYIFASHTTCGIDYKHVDSKVIYSKSLGDGKVDECVEIVDENIERDDLYRLALISGVYSRFKLDENFPSDAYNRMYTEWMEMSIKGELADYIFVYKEHGRVRGMVTVKINNTTAILGLVAVDYDAQGQGVASKLIQTVENHLCKLGTIKTFNVATQLVNHSACHLYEKNGFKVSSITDIYHYWVK